MNPDAEGVADYYDGAQMDFRRWSPTHHLHFGYCSWGAGPFHRERMLQRMSHEVLTALQLEAPMRILDLGCGFGTTARLAAKRFPSAEIHGLTLSPTQALAATERSREEGLETRATFSCASYLAIPEAPESIDAAYAIESACYAPGTSKAAFLHEAARVLRGGGRLVVADAFVRHTRPLRGLARTFHDALCTRWKLPCLGVLDDFLAALREAGFVDVRVRDISLRVGPSVLHVPFLTAAALLSRAIRNDPTRRANAMAPLYALLLALVPRTVGYYVIEATRVR
jgi:MPBQ/MSBQ methyltransferase